MVLPAADPLKYKYQKNAWL